MKSTVKSALLAYGDPGAYQRIVMIGPARVTRYVGMRDFHRSAVHDIMATIKASGTFAVCEPVRGRLEHSGDVFFVDGAHRVCRYC